MNTSYAVRVVLTLAIALLWMLQEKTYAQSTDDGWQGPRPTPQRLPPSPTPQRPYPSGKQVMEIPPQVQQSERPAAPQQMEIPSRIQPESPRPTQLLTVTVTDPQGRYVTGLQSEDFVVYEEDLPQHITYFSTGQEEPVSLGFLVDTSGSMENKISRARHALRRFFASVKSGDEVFLEAFSDQTRMVQEFTDSKELLDDGVSQLRPNGGTALYDTLLDGLRHIKRGRHQKQALVLLTDGLDEGSQASFHEVETAVRRSGVPIYTVGIGNPSQGSYAQGMGSHGQPFPGGGQFPGSGLPGLGIPGLSIPGLGLPGGGGGRRGGVGMRGPRRASNEGVNVKVLQEFSAETGGRHFLLNTNDVIGNDEVLDRAIQAISEELRQQYTVGYKSSLKGDVYRNVHIELRRPGLSARAQKGLG